MKEGGRRRSVDDKRDFGEIVKYVIIGTLSWFFELAVLTVALQPFLKPILLVAAVSEASELEES